MLSLEGLRAMERIAREKAGTPEGEVARRKLERFRTRNLCDRLIGVTRFWIDIRVDMTRLSQAMDATTRSSRKMGETVEQEPESQQDESVL